MGSQTTGQVPASAATLPPVGTSRPRLTFLGTGYLGATYAICFAELGYEVLAAKTVHDALRIAEEHHFDILLSDIGLPDGSGLELLRQLSRRRKVPALALSGFGMDEDIERSQAAGFADHLTKPVSIDRLQAAISQLEAEVD